VDIAKIHIGGLGQRCLHAVGSTNTIATKNLTDINSIGDGINSPSELQRAKAMAVRAIVLGPHQRDEGKPQLV
jgi:thiamine monophosphate synthase